MKPIPIKPKSLVFDFRRKVSIFQTLQSQDMANLMRYFYDHVLNFKKMWKEQGREYWLRYCLTLHNEIKIEKSTDEGINVYMQEKELFALELIKNCLCGHTFSPVNKFMEMVWKTYKDLYKILSTASEKTSISAMAIEGEEWKENLLYLFGQEYDDFPAMTNFFDLCEIYFFAAGSLTKICQEFEGPKYSSDKPFKQKDYWLIPSRWSLKNYEATPFEIKIIGNHETEILKFLKEEGKRIPWIEENMEDMKEQCTHAEEEICLEPKELEFNHKGLRELYATFFLSVPEIFEEFCLNPECSWDWLLHPENQFYFNFYHSIFNSKFFSHVNEEIKSLLQVTEQKKGAKDDKSKEKFDDLRKIVTFFEKTTAFTERRLSWSDYDFDFDKDLELISNGKDESESDQSCSSLLDAKYQNEWNNWDPCDNSHLESHQATLDRLPWDIPYLMAWQENLLALCLKMDFGAIPLRIFPVNSSCQQAIINFNRLLRESIFLLFSSMVIADYVFYLEGEIFYNWTHSIDYRKKLHEIGYRLRPILDFSTESGPNAIQSLIEKAWAQSKTDTRIKWIPGCWDLVFEEMEEHFFNSPRHYFHWESAPTKSESALKGFRSKVFEKINQIVFNKVNCEQNLYYPTETTTNATRYDLNFTEKALESKFGPDLKLDASQVVESMVKSNFLSKQECSRFQKKLSANKVPLPAIGFITSLGLIHKKCEAIQKKTDKWGEDMSSALPDFIGLLINHRKTECGFKINCAVQELINDDPKYIPKPATNNLDDVLEQTNDKYTRKLNLQEIESIVKKVRKRVWADNPIPFVNKKQVSPLKKEHSYKIYFWKSQSLCKSYALLEKHRTELIRIVVNKYFSVEQGTTGVRLFPYWRTLVCFIHAELFTLVKLYKVQWDSNDAMAKMLQLLNYRMLWLREKVMEWCADMKGVEDSRFCTKNAIRNFVSEQYARIRLASNTLRDLYVSRFTVNEKVQPMTKAMMNYSIFVQVLLSRIYDVNDKNSNFYDLEILLYGNCFLKNVEELVDYLETFQNHACLCWNYKTLEFHPTFRPASFENCESIIYILKNLLYLCLISIEDRSEVQNELEICLLKVHSMESEIIDQKAVRGPSSPETDDFNLYMACTHSWQFFYEMYEKAKKKKEFSIPKTFQMDCIEWRKILQYFKNDDLYSIKKFIKLDKIQNYGFFGEKGMQFGPCSTCPECNTDLIRELRNLKVTKKTGHDAKKCSDAKKGGKNKKKEPEKDPDELSEKEVADIFTSILNGNPDKPLTRNLLSKNKPAAPVKRNEFNLDMSCDQFKKIVSETIHKNYDIPKEKPAEPKKAEEPKKAGKPEADIASQGLKKMLGALANHLEGESKNAKVRKVETANTATQKTKNVEYLEPKIISVKGGEKVAVSGLVIASEGMKKMFNMNRNSKPEKKDVKKTVPEKLEVKDKKSVAQKEEPKKVEEDDKSKICAGCKAKAPEGVKFKKCGKCKEDNRANAKYYCGRDCQLNDWSASHRNDHVKK